MVAENKKAGKVKFFNNTKGFGFITPDDGSEDLFVHQTSIHASGFRSLADGEDVEFEVQVSDDGRSKAVNVTGPNGAYVKGTPREPRQDSRSGGYVNRGVYGDSSGGGYGGDSGGYGRSSGW